MYITMKKSIRLFGMLLSLVALTVFVACSDDDGGSIIDDGNGDDDGRTTFTVAPGLYIANVDGDTTITNAMILNDTKSSGTDLNVPLPRTGYKTNYVYLEAGNHMFAVIGEDQKIETLIGGPVTAVDTTDAPADGFDIVATEVGGASFGIAAAGVYHVAHDDQRSEGYLVAVNRWGILGTSLEKGFNEDFDMTTQSSSADGTTWEGTEIVMRPGTFKIRYNDTWTIIPETGFDIFTNFGGTVDVLDPGSNDIAFDGEGTYTVTLNLSSTGQMSLTLTRTGDAPVITFDPNEYQFGTIGDATAGGWDSDRDLFYKGLDGTKGHWWAGVAYLESTGEFKFRTNDDWTFSLGGTLTADGTSSTLDIGGGNIAVPGEAGAYYFEISTTDEGTTWNAIMNASGWGVIGEGSPQGNWDADLDMTANGFSEGVTTYTITGDFTTSGWKFRANDDWAVNLGGDLTGLSLDGANIELSAGGTFTATLSVSLDGEGKTVYTATVE